MTDLDPDELRRISKTVADIYGDATVRLLEVVKRRMAQGADEPGWAEAKLLEIAGLRADAAEVIAQLEVDAPPALRKAIEDAHRFGAMAAHETATLSPTLKPVTNQRAVEALARETITKVTGTHGGILRSVDDMFRTIIAEVSAPGVVSGSESTGAAVQRALNRFADAGITGFRDKAGRNWRLDTYAEMATRTSAGRAMIDGRVEQYVADGREFVIVSDSPQECKLCRPFEGRGLSISGRGVGTDVGGIRIIATLDEARRAGLQHPNCFPGWVSVSGPAPTAGDRRWYEGDLVVIHTASGIELPVTPNHPILTPRGWVDAGSLDVGDHVIRHSVHGEGRGAAGDDPDEELRPSSISDAFGALWESVEMSTVTVPASPEQFHGDGTVDGEVDVVAPARLLLDDLESSFDEQLSESGLAGVGMRPSTLVGGGPLLEGGLCVFHASNGFVGGSDERFSVGVAHALPPADSGGAPSDASVMAFQQVGDCGLGDTAPGADRRLSFPSRVAGEDFFSRRFVDEERPSSDPGLIESAAHDLLADADGGRDLAHRLAALVAPDQIVNVDRYPWRGHVFNLQTTPGWYAANAIVVHNCTHDLRPVIPGLTRPFQSTETPEPARKAAAVAAKAEAEVKRQDRRAAVAMDPASAREANEKRRNAVRVAERARAQEKAAKVDVEAKTKASVDEFRQQVAQSAKASKVAKSALDRASKASSTTAQGKAARRLKAGLAVAAVVASLADSDDLTESQALQLAVAAERLARGEITDEEYRRLVREITGTDSRGRRR